LRDLCALSSRRSTCFCGRRCNLPSPCAAVDGPADAPRLPFGTDAAPFSVLQRLDAPRLPFCPCAAPLNARHLAPLQRLVALRRCSAPRPAMRRLVRDAAPFSARRCGALSASVEPM